MQALTLPTKRGWRWLADGFLIYRKNRLMLSLFVLAFFFLLMFMINSFPFIGNIAAALLMPVFSVVMMNACRAIEQDSPLRPQLIFSGFNRNLPALITLGGIYPIINLCVLGISAFADGGVLFRFFVQGIQPDKQAVESEVMLALFIAIILFVPVIMAFWYAPVLRAWHSMPLSKALFFSFVACARNWRAFTAYVFSVIALGILILNLTTGLVSILFAENGNFNLILLMAITMVALMLLPTLYASLYVSYRDVFVTIDEDA